MPTTLTGLVLFVVLLLPGFAYLVGKERAGTERRVSGFRETVSIVAASATSELALTVALAPVWSRFLDVDRLVAQPGAYWRSNPGLLAGWTLGLLAVATTAAYVATLPKVRRWFRWLTGRYPHPSSVSSWWMLFEHWNPAPSKHVACVLEDGSWVEGRLASFNQAADDNPDRDLILVDPIKFAFNQDDDAQPYPAGAVCISARRIVTMFVSYMPADYDDESATSTTESASREGSMRGSASVP